MIALMLLATLAAAEERCYPNGLETEAYCKSLTTQDGISLHMMRLPAIHPTPHPDPLFILAGGPGQAATEIAPLLDKRFQSIRTKRDKSRRVHDIPPDETAIPRSSRTTRLLLKG